MSIKQELKNKPEDNINDLPEPIKEDKKAIDDLIEDSDTPPEISPEEARKLAEAQQVEEAKKLAEAQQVEVDPEPAIDPGYKK